MLWPIIASNSVKISGDKIDLDKVKERVYTLGYRYRGPLN